MERRRRWWWWWWWSRMLIGHGASPALRDNQRAGGCCVNRSSPCLREELEPHGNAPHAMPAALGRGRRDELDERRAVQVARHAARPLAPRPTTRRTPDAAVSGQIPPLVPVFPLELAVPLAAVPLCRCAAVPLCRCAAVPLRRFGGLAYEAARVGPRRGVNAHARAPRPSCSLPLRRSGCFAFLAGLLIGLLLFTRVNSVTNGVLCALPLPLPLPLPVLSFAFLCLFSAGCAVRAFRLLRRAQREREREREGE